MITARALALLTIGIVRSLLHPGPIAHPPLPTEGLRP